jgi:multidrug efflux pump subunit AcrB
MTLRRIGSDILPVIDTPVVAAVFSYAGMPPEEMDKRIISNFERLLTTTVNDVEHIESQCVNGTGIVRVFFQPGARVDAAIAQVTAVGQASIGGMPPGMKAPLVINYDAGNVPVLIVSLSSETLSEQQIFDLGNISIRNSLAAIQGAKINNPIGGKNRGIIIDLDPARLAAYGLDANAVNEALNRQNLNLPAGYLPLGIRDYPVRLNSSPATIAEFADLPVATRDGVLVRVRDVADVRDGYAPQTTLAHVDGRRGVIQLVRKVGGASTLDVADRVRAGIGKILTTVPEELKVELLADQSVFVRSAIHGVASEGLVAGGLTALLILLALGSWRSTLVVVASIPLAICAALIALGALGYTLNLMTLGGLALAVGILVDDATVEIENIHRNLALMRAGGRVPDLQSAIIAGAGQIAIPTFVSTLCICIVFVPVAFLSEPIRSLFVPMAVAVVVAMATSYVLSRTLVPTLVNYLLPGELAGSRRGLLAWIHARSDAAFLTLRGAYGHLLAWLLAQRTATLLGFALVVGAAAWIAPSLGQELFPRVDAGLIRLHVRAPPGSRIEETERRVAQVSDTIRTVIPPGEIDNLIDTQGPASSPFNAPLHDASLNTAADAEIQIYLTPQHRPTAEHIRALRAALAEQHPDLVFFLKPADIPAQVLTFGLPAPIVIQLTGPLGVQAANLAIADRIRKELRQVPGAVDVRLHQVAGVPDLRVDVDRTLAARDGLSQSDVANSTLVALTSATQINPGFWFDPTRGIQYNVSVRQPGYRLATLDTLRDLPVGDQRLADMATISRGTTWANVTHYNVNTTIDVLAAVEGTDLGEVASAAKDIIARITPDLPRGSSIRLRGVAESLDRSFSGLLWGLALAVVLIYLVLVVNFHSWRDPLIILAAIPGALAGVVLILHVTQTACSVPALMGAILGTGVATANSILVVSFANERHRAGVSARLAAWQAGTTRLRPVLMTAAAMIVGMIPMALGLSDGGEQNAPLGRAVIGALSAATLTTLVVVPVVFSWRGQPTTDHAAHPEQTL